jgi:glyoxylase-like metal-dependent hydrolase (beta-lactamase superfamily II)
MPRLKQLLQALDLGWRDIQALILTHGHLDHAGNLARLQELTGAPVLAHPAEQAHLDGAYPYTGAARVCGVMEAVGRRALRYRPARIDRELKTGELLPYWGGLRVLHLPGHTRGHCGFHSERFDLMFTGDLFASYWFSAHLPPRFLNSCTELLPASLRKVQELGARQLIPNHYSEFNGELHRRRFDKLLARLN